MAQCFYLIGALNTCLVNIDKYLHITIILLSIGVFHENVDTVMLL